MAAWRSSRIPGYADGNEALANRDHGPEQD
jgi:hypothetical protein